MYRHTFKIAAAVAVLMSTTLVSATLPREARACCAAESQERALQRATHVFVGKVFPQGSSVPIGGATFKVRVERVLWGDNLRTGQEIDVHYDTMHGGASIPGRVVVFANWDAQAGHFEIPTCSIASVRATPAVIRDAIRVGTTIGRIPTRTPRAAVRTR